MSLNFDYSKVATLPNGDDPKHQPLDEKRWHSVGDALVWQSLAVGLGVIDDKNIDKWVQRISLLQSIDGPLLRWGDGTKAYITRRDIEAFKGLRTNVSAKSDAEFAKSLLQCWNEVKNDDGRAAFEIVHAQAEKYAKTKEVA